MRNLSTSNVLAGLAASCVLLLAHDLYENRQIRIQAIEKKLKVQQECFQMQERMTRIAAERKWWLTIPQCPEVL